MQDRFKFKGYWYNDVQKEWWVYDEPQFITGDGTAEIWYNSEGGAQPELPPNADLHLCQCTGLKDKNGKLVYEGDIVKFRNFDNRYYIGTIKHTDEDALFCLSYINENKRQDWEYVSRFKLEIIGNIYENPELLED